MEVIFFKEDGNELLGLKTNLNGSNRGNNLLKFKEHFAILNLGLKKTKDTQEIRGMLLFFTENQSPSRRSTFEEFLLSNQFIVKKTLSFLESEKWIASTKEGIIEGPRAYIELAANIK
ncbi:hypothetical protein HWI79_2177 [Cryptosporidium felis]|nr:hypothetical protein HWI79_2177 [Cryptosporidium felis]